jgi:lysophospholipase L1-like esterase
MSRRPAVLSWLITPTLLTVLTVLVAAPAQAADPVDYVALGDSYAAGLGTVGAAGWCGRSPRGYPQLWADRHAVSSFRSVACLGATTADVLRDQVSALRAGTDLVSLTVGGNDAGFAPTVVSCVVADDAACTAAVRTARVYIAAILPGRLDTTYAAIRRRAPQARVVVIAYPRLFDPTADCGSGGMSIVKRRAINAAADDLAAVVRARAGAAGFVFADVRAAFDGHGICSRSPWVNSLSVLRPADSFHPNAAGYAGGYLPALAAAAD